MLRLLAFCEMGKARSWGRNPATSCREMPGKGTSCTGYLHARHQIGMPEPFAAGITIDGNGVVFVLSMTGLADGVRHRSWRAATRDASCRLDYAPSTWIHRIRLHLHWHFPPDPRYDD